MGKKGYCFMYNVRHITFRRLWLFSGCLALLLTLMGLSLLLSPSSAHAAPVQGCKETIMKGANGQLTTINCGGEGPKTIEKGANGQRTTIQRCACVGGQEATVGESCPVLPS